MHFLNILVHRIRLLLALSILIFAVHDCSAKRDEYGRKIQKTGYSLAPGSGHANSLFVKHAEQERIKDALDDKNRDLLALIRIINELAGKGFADIKTFLGIKAAAAADAAAAAAADAPADAAAPAAAAPAAAPAAAAPAAAAEAAEYIRYFQDLKSWARVQTEKGYANAKELKLAEYNRRKEWLEASCTDLEQYDATPNILMRAFLPDYAGGSGSNLPSKILLMAGVPVVTSLRKSLDEGLGKVSDGFVAWLLRKGKVFAVSIGWASPLSIQKVQSWITLVGSYKKAMNELKNASASDPRVAESFNGREGDRPNKQVVLGGDATEGHELVSKESDEMGDDLAAFMKNAAPMYVRASEVFVKQLRSQISIVLQGMGNNYDEQQETLNDLLKMLDGLEKMIVGSHAVYRHPILTSSVNADLMAGCDWLMSQMTLLLGMINDGAAETAPAKPNFADGYDRQGLGRNR